MTDALPSSPPKTGRWRWAAGKRPLVTGQSRPIAARQASPKRPVARTDFLQVLYLRSCRSRPPGSGHYEKTSVMTRPWKTSARITS